MDLLLIGLSPVIRMKKIVSARSKLKIHPEVVFAKFLWLSCDEDFSSSFDCPQVLRVLLSLFKSNYFIVCSRTLASVDFRSLNGASGYNRSQYAIRAALPPNQELPGQFCFFGPIYIMQNGVVYTRF